MNTDNKLTDRQITKLLLYLTARLPIDKKVKGMTNSQLVQNAIEHIAPLTVNHPEADATLYALFDRIVPDWQNNNEIVGEI